MHVRGSFLVSQAALPVHEGARLRPHRQHLRRAPGLFGNFGQANYSTAKMGLVGLTKTLGIEGAQERHQGQRHRADRLDADDRGDPAGRVRGQVHAPSGSAPLVAYLVHESCEASGEVFSVGGGRVARVFVAEGPGWQQRRPHAGGARGQLGAVMAEQPYVLTAADSMKAML